MNELSIGEVARQAGLRTSAVRYYEQRGLLPAPRRVNGRRLYSPDVIQRLAVIQFAQRTGFTLEEIRNLILTPERVGRGSDQWRRVARQKLVQLDAWIEDIQHMKALLERGSECTCRQAEECILVDRTWWSATEQSTRRVIDQIPPRKQA